MNSTAPDLICIDASALDDLMFWNQLARAFAPRPGEPPLLPPAVLMVGSGERTERAVADPLMGATRTGGLLPITPDKASAFERSIREENKSVVFRLTDEGIATVGFLAADRNLAVHRDGRIETGNWSVVAQTVARGVVPVVSAVACTPSGQWVDADPVDIARNVAGSWDSGCRIVVMAQRLTPSLRQSLETGVGVDSETLRTEGALPDWRLSSLSGTEWIHHVEWLGRTAPTPIT